APAAIGVTSRMMMSQRSFVARCSSLPPSRTKAAVWPASSRPLQDIARRVRGWAVSQICRRPNTGVFLHLPENVRPDVNDQADRDGEARSTDRIASTRNRWREMDSNRRCPAKEQLFVGCPRFDPPVRIPQHKPVPSRQGPM